MDTVHTHRPIADRAIPYGVRYETIDGNDPVAAWHGIDRAMRYCRRERKPFLLDTASPFAHELLRHLVRDGGAIGFEEMFPTPEGLFLRDSRGRYTFELRMQAERWSPGAAPEPSGDPS